MRAWKGNRMRGWVDLPYPRGMEALIDNVNSLSGE